MKPDMRSDTAVNIILRHLLQVMKLNERFIQQDIDTEFLHDYRVAVRRTRSALSQIKAVFPESQTNRFKEDFKYIGQLSNQLRDLDVYLLAETEYKNNCQSSCAQTLIPCLIICKANEKAPCKPLPPAWKRLNTGVFLQEWELFLEEPPPEDKTAVNAAMPILKLAQKRIYKRVRGILKEGHSILQDNRDERLHALRLECKKLRYLMEFFASLFPPDDISHLIRQLKQLQGNLGDFNDLCVQEVYLLHVAREMPLRSQASRDALIAIGCLVGALHQRREQVKSEFAATFNAFAAPANEALFIKCFAPKKAGKKQKKGGRS
ncbi:MAG: CHAD domain-containing protein [Chloroflexi bacterium]|nr:CHAD domain-containing protein [Chloroflexota bacterium]